MDNTHAAREAIFASIRSHLAASASHDVLESELHHHAPAPPVVVTATPTGSLIDLFKSSLEAVDGHCLVVRDELEVVDALTQIIRQLQGTRLRARAIAISDDAEVERLIQQTDLDVDELAITPSAEDVFRFDVGISRAQAGIAETGTLLLDSSRERHRLVSLVPPVHIAILHADQIVGTLGEALSLLRQGEQVTPLATFVTGPSRTADIELTLAIGVHGPQELFVIVSG
ncbi:MAG TPA: lactate utilization protein [Pyrinomonadaceae bacterium]